MNYNKIVVCVLGQLLLVLHMDMLQFYLLVWRFPWLLMQWTIWLEGFYGGTRQIHQTRNWM